MYYIYLPLYIINQPCIRDEKFQEISTGNFKQANTISGYFFFKKILMTCVERSGSGFVNWFYDANCLSRRGCLESVKELCSSSFQQLPLGGVKNLAH